MDRPTATLRLRGVGGPVEARLHCPQQDGSRQLVIAFVDGATAKVLCAEMNAVVIQIRSTPELSVQPLVEWIVAHATELGATANDVVVTGNGDGATTASELVEAALVSGWPPVRLLNTEAALDHPLTADREATHLRRTHDVEPAAPAYDNRVRTHVE